MKDVWRFNGCVVALGRFIFRLGERVLFFFRVMKKKGSVDWISEVEAAFQEFKQYLRSSFIFVVFKLGESLLFYLAATDQVVSSVLVV
ncbi:hypothetical protein EHS14_03080, partial [Schaalia georgiae]